MATRILQAMTEQGTHEIGNLNNIKIKTLNHGAIVVDADIDNYTMVSLGFNAEGERTCTQLADEATPGRLIASVETLNENLGEELVDFYNAVGERARIVILESGYTRFDTSAFNVDGVTVATVGDIAAGNVAHWDTTNKVFLIHDGTHASYAGAANKFLVVNNEADLEYTCGKTLVKLEVI